MRNILFVCTGNTCRSPMAEAFCKQLIQEKGFKELSCSSAGLAAYPGSPASEFSIKVMGEVGIDLSGHRSQPLNAEMVAQADEIWVLSPSHKQAIAAAMPQFSGKIFVLGNGIPDPYGYGIEVYRSCRDEIKKAVEQIPCLRGGN